MVGNKRGKKGKKKKVWVRVWGRKKEGGKKRKKKEGEPTYVERKKKEKKREILSQYFHNKS